MIVFIADDHSSITWVVTVLVANCLGDQPHQPKVVGDVQSLLDGLDQAPSEPSLVILDLSMPGELKRLSLIEEVRRRAPLARIVVYSASDAPLLVEAAFELGIAAYVPKAAPLRRLQDAIVEVGHGRSYIDPSIQLEAAASHPWKALTPAERDVVVALAKGQDLRTFARDTGRAYQTVANQKYAAQQKLGVGGVIELSNYLVQHGLDYLLDPRPGDSAE